MPHEVFVSDQHAPSIRAEGEKPPEEVEPEAMVVDQPPELNLEDPDWWFPILKWLVEGKLPSEQTEAQCIASRAKAFVLINNELYKRGAADILMRCILLMVKIRQPSHEFTFGVGISFIPYPLVLTPVV
jgi:hypothetical protein